MSEPKENLAPGMTTVRISQQLLDEVEDEIKRRGRPRSTRGEILAEAWGVYKSLLGKPPITGIGNLGSSKENKKPIEFPIHGESAGISGVELKEVKALLHRANQVIEGLTEAVKAQRGGGGKAPGKAGGQ